MELKRIVSWNYPNKNIIHWDYIESFPETQALKETPQSPIWHAEGNAWNHTKLVVEHASNLAEFAGLDIPDTEILVTAALLHDIGKPATTFTDDDGKIHSYKHEIESERITRKLLWEEDIYMRERICRLVRLHMDIHKIKNYWKFETFKKHIIDLMNSTEDFYLLCLLCMSDTKGAQYDPEAKCTDVEKCEELCDFACDPNRRLDWRIKQLWRTYFPTNQTVIVLCGLPGSGKSTYASTQNATILSRDTIREELGICEPGQKCVGTMQQESKVSELFDQRFVDALKRGENIIVDNINLRRSYRDRYKELAKHHNVSWIYVYFQTEHLAINEIRRPEISHDIFMNMIDKFDFPDKSEYDNILIVNGDV